MSEVLRAIIRRITGEPVSSLQEAEQDHYFWQCFIEEIKKSLVVDLEASYTRAVYLYGSENDDYMRMYHHYMNSIAGILAKDLKEGTPCPVCGSLHHPKPCLIEGREISQELLFKKEAASEVKNYISPNQTNILDQISAVDNLEQGK